MSTLIDIGYPDETTAGKAADEAQRLVEDLTIQPDAIAVVRRDTSGKFHVTTNHHEVGLGAGWGMFWGLPPKSSLSKADEPPEPAQSAEPKEHGA